MVEGKMAEPHAHDDEVVWQPAKAKQNCYDHNHLGHPALGEATLTCFLHGVYTGPQVADGSGVCKTQDQDGNEVAKYKSTNVHGSTALDVPGRDAHSGSI